MRAPKLFLIVMLLCASGAACAKARAQIEPVMPDLLPPPPPPRIVEVFPLAPLPTIDPSPVESALASLPPRLTARPSTKPEPPKVEVPLPPPERAPVPPSSLTLKPGPTVQAQTEASIRGLLDRALRDLQKVNYAALNSDGRAQFEIARRFMQQADDALKASNLPFAGKLADKAANMASVLVR